MGNSVSTVPLDAQINTLNASLSCVVNTNFPPEAGSIAISTTAPLVGGSGQQVNFTDLSVDIGVAQTLYVAQGFYSASYYVANITVTVDTTNASPGVSNITGSVDRHDFSSTILSLPAPIDSIGPVTLGEIGQTDLRLRSVHYTVLFYKADGSLAYNSPVPVDCIASRDDHTLEYTLATVVVDDSEVGPLLAPSLNQTSDLPPTSIGQKSSSAHLMLDCFEQELAPREVKLDYIVTATGPALVTAAQPFNLTNIETFITVPGQLVDGLTGFYGDGLCALILETLQDHGIPGLSVSLNASPSLIDASVDFVPSEPDTHNPLVNGRYVSCGSENPVVYPLPNWQHLNLVNITAQAGSSFSIGFPGAHIKAQGINTHFGIAGTLTLVCNATSPSILLSAPVVAP